MPRPSKTLLAWVIAGLLPLLVAGPAQAQKAKKTETFTPQVTGVLGSSDATTTISGKQLPAPDPKFGGVIKETIRGLIDWWKTLPEERTQKLRAGLSAERESEVIAAWKAQQS